MAGARALSGTSERVLRVLFGVLVAAMAAQMIASGLRGSSDGRSDGADNRRPAADRSGRGRGVTLAEGLALSQYGGAMSTTTRLRRAAELRGS